PQRLGLFESRRDGFNFLYDIFLGVRSHRCRRSKLRPLAALMPTRHARRRVLKLLHSTAVSPVR
ncbi:MAG: beta-carotene hydroxylase, partial [Cyanobacteria bacterium M_surface_9_m1_291]|nr:beta-carotene hydroxylase [Cyanobacteria bacterium M_surface_9_m1_291]